MNDDFELDRGQCKSCGAAIRWAKTAAGKPIPLDATPEQRFVPLNSSMVKLHQVYRSHFQTCPNAAEHRKPRSA